MHPPWLPQHVQGSARHAMFESCAQKANRIHENRFSGSMPFLFLVFGKRRMYHTIFILVEIARGEWLCYDFPANGIVDSSTCKLIPVHDYRTAGVQANDFFMLFQHSPSRPQCFVGTTLQSTFSVIMRNKYSALMPRKTRSFLWTHAKNFNNIGDLPIIQHVWKGTEEGEASRCKTRIQILYISTYKMQILQHTCKLIISISKYEAQIPKHNHSLTFGYHV